MSEGKSIRTPTLLPWGFPGATWKLGDFPKIMGIVNVTPDSFSDGSQYLDPGLAAEHVAHLVAMGADLLDIGGESTRPGATPVPPEEELRRVLPVIERIANETRVPLSIDTRNAEVAQRALDSGAVIVNDVSGLTFDPAMASVCARAEAGVICMHMQGTPATMQQNPHYDDVLAEVAAYLAERLDALEQAGIPRERIVIDPGIGFGKTAAHNLTILQNVDRFRTGPTDPHRPLAEAIPGKASRTARGRTFGRDDRRGDRPGGRGGRHSAGARRQGDSRRAERVCRDSKKMNRRDTRNITAVQDRETGPHKLNCREDDSPGLPY